MYPIIMRSLYKIDYQTDVGFKESTRKSLLKVANEIADKRLYGSLLKAKDIIISLRLLLTHFVSGFQHEESYVGLTTRKITVTEVGGNGSYYFVNGYYRKPGGKVKVLATPPEGLNVYSIVISGVVVSNQNQVYKFTMPDRDINVTITYSTEIPALEGIGYWIIEDNFIIS